MRKRSEEEVKEIVEHFDYEFLGEYFDSNHRRVIIKDSEGYKYDTKLLHLTKNHIPNFVSIDNPFSLENISLWLVKSKKDFELLDNNEYRGSKEKLFFKCLNEKCGEVFYHKWNNIYSSNFGCSYCSGRRVGKYNNFEYLRPELAKEWDYSKSKSDPDKYTQFSREKVFWICSVCNHSWKTGIGDRSMGNGCPRCSGRVSSENNNLLFLRPDLILEWDYKKNDKSPDKYTEKSSKEVFWICSQCNYSWKSKIYARSNGSGCPKCNLSKGERKILSLLDKTEMDFYIEYLFENCKRNKTLWFDFYIEKYNLAIEHDGEQHFFPVDFAGKGEEWAKKEFKKVKKRDKIKTEYCENNNITLLRIPYWEFDNIENILEKTLSELE